MKPEEKIEEVDTVYEVYHAAGTCFGGNHTLRVAVTEEDEDQIKGYQWTFGHGPGLPVVVNKANVAGWRERPDLPDAWVEKNEES